MLIQQSCETYMCAHVIIIRNKDFFCETEKRQLLLVIHWDNALTQP